MALKTEVTSLDGEMETTNVDSTRTLHKPLSFQPVDDPQDHSPAKRNTWSHTSQPLGHSYSISSKFNPPSQSSQPPTHSYSISPKHSSCEPPSQLADHSYTTPPEPSSPNPSSQPPSHVYPNSPHPNLSNPPSQPPTHAYPITPRKPSTKIDIPPTNLLPTPAATPVSSRRPKRTYSTALEVRIPATDFTETSPLTRTRKRRFIHTLSVNYDGVLETASPTLQPAKHPRTNSHAHTPSSPSPSPAASTPKKPPPPHTRPKTHHTIPPTATPTHSPHRNSPFRTDLTPRFSIAYKPPTTSDDAISWQELKLVAESVLGQVDWEVVAMQVGSNRRAWRYRRALREVLQERIYEMAGRGEEGG